MTRLKHAWQDLATQETHGVLERDVSRATLLAEAVEEELTQAEIAELLGLARPYISQLLLYNRFVVAQGNIKISEKRFRQYWKQMGKFKGIGKLHADPIKAACARQKYAAERAEHEEKVFRTIAAWVEQGEAPLKTPKPAPPPKAAARPTGRRPRLSPLRKEVTQIYKTELYADVKAIETMMRDNGTLKFAPAHIAAHAHRIRQGMLHLQQVLKEHQLLDEMTDD